MLARSPLGLIKDEDLPECLSSLSPREREKALAVNAAFREHYIAAIKLAVQGRRRHQLDLAGLRDAIQKRRATGPSSRLLAPATSPLARALVTA